MKHKSEILCIVLSCLIVTGCSSKADPKDLLNDPADKPYINTETTTLYYDSDDICESWDNIPENFKPLGDNLFAIVENDSIVGYRRGFLINEKWQFEVCDERGNLIVTTVITSSLQTSTTTTATVTAKEKDDNNEKTNVNNGDIHTGGVSDNSTNNSDTQNNDYTYHPQEPNAVEHQKPPVTTVITTAPPQPVTTAHPVQDKAKFSYKIVNGLSGLPADVSGYFQSSIDQTPDGTILTRSSKSGNSWYAIVYVKNGPSLTIRSVTKDGVISYKAAGSTENTVCYVVVVEGVNNISFNKV